MEYLKKTGKGTLLLPALIFCCLAANAATENNDLFEYLPTPQSAESRSKILQDKASHPIRINRNTSAFGVGDHLNLPLPDGSYLKLIIDNKWSAGNGDVQISGRFQEDGWAIITFGEDSVFANFSNRNLNYGISIDGNQQSLLIDHKATGNIIDLGDDMRVEKGASSSEQFNLQSPSTVAKASASNKSVITLLAVYSPQFGNAFTNPVTRINQMIAFTNQAYQRSGVHIDLQLAHAQQIPFDNGISVSTLLDRVTNATNAFSGIRALRNQHFADMVAVLPFSSGGSVSGVAWVNGNRDRHAYSVARFAFWGSDAVFAHELGHNLGSGHELLSANPSQQSPCRGGYTGYSCGHGNGNRGTIMSYLNDAGWNFVFSNPELDCTGEPCGIAQGQPNAADNKTSFNITGPLIEAFRVDTSNDDDKDGVKNNVDNCPDTYNPNQLDTDSDNTGDVCDNDDDDDGINDGADNCPLIRNPLQTDTDNNGRGDVCQDDEACFPVNMSNGAISMICL